MTDLALFGGEPVRTTPYPAWPVQDERELEAVNAVIRSGQWGGYPYPGPQSQAFAQGFAQMQQGHGQTVGEPVFVQILIGIGYVGVLGVGEVGEAQQFALGVVQHDEEILCIDQFADDAVHLVQHFALVLLAARDVGDREQCTLQALGFLVAAQRCFHLPRFEYPGDASRDQRLGLA